MSSNRGFLVACLASALTAACGARTGLPVDGGDVAFASDAGPTANDADARVDGATSSSTFAVLPKPAGAASCKEPSLRSTIYLLHEGNQLWTFEPPNRFRELPPLLCDTRGLGEKAVSIAVDRDAMAYVLYDDGELFRVSVLDTSSCKPTGWTPRTSSFHTFAMAFVAEGSGEALFAADATSPSSLARLTPPTLGAPTSLPSMSAPALSGNAAGQLFALYLDRDTGAAALSTLDSSTGGILARAALPSLSLGSASAFAPFGGDVYLFVDRDGDSESLRFDPASGTSTDLGGLTGRIVSASVSTCAG